jgi:hypothetical protein
MPLSRARDWDFEFKHLIGGLTFYPYQLAVGMTIRYWPNVFAPSIRIHIGPFKVWCCWIKTKKEHNLPIGIDPKGKIVFFKEQS